MRRFIFLCFLSCLFTSSFTHAQVAKDIPGAKDYAEIGRYPGSLVSAYIHNEFDSYRFPLETNTYEASDVFDSKLLEGERTTIVYDVPQTVTTSLLKVFRSLGKGMVDRGFETKLSCSSEQGNCGFFFPRALLGDAKIRELFSTFRELYNLDASNAKFLIYSGVLIKEGISHYAVVIVGQSKYSAHIQYSVDVLKQTALKTEELVLTVNEMEKSLSASGKVALNGIYFEHDSSTITSQSDPALDVIAQYLRDHPEQKFLVVGHTDAKGDWDYNRKLSASRARAVIIAVRLRVRDAGKMTPFGVGFAAPADTNVTEAGRAKNRRVELVLIPD